MNPKCEPYQVKMEKSIEVMKQDFNTIRAGRANAAVLDKITVDYYGTATPIQQIASISTPEPRMLSIQPWDASALKLIEKAILASDLGITPNNDGTGTIRLNFPAPTEERRREIVKECKNIAEKHGRTGVRNARQDAKKKMERAQKDGEMSEDDLKRAEAELQKLTDKYVGKVDEMLSTKEAEVMEI